MQFARENPNVNVVGVGAGTAANGDSLDGAYDFVARFDPGSAGMTMLYDVSFRAWRTFGVTTQPWMVIFNSRGEMIYSQAGRVDLSTVSAALG